MRGRRRLQSLPGLRRLRRLQLRLLHFLGRLPLYLLGESAISIARAGASA